MSMKALAIVDHHSELVFIRKKIQQASKDCDDEMIRLKAAYEEYCEGRREQINGFFKEAAAVLQSKGLLTKNFKYVEDLRFTENDQVLAQVESKAHSECDCFFCQINRQFGGKP